MGRKSMPQPKVAAVGDYQADQADGGDLPVEEPLEEVGGDQGGVDVEHIADDLQ